MSENAKAQSVNRAKPYQLVLFPLNNGATNVYYVLVLSYIATFGSKVLALSMIFASVMVTGMRLFDAVTDPIIGALMDRTNGKFGKFRPFMVIGNLIMAVSILVLYCVTPLIPDTMIWARYAAFVGLYAVWVIGYTFQTSCTRSGQTVLTNDPKQRPLFTIFNTVGSLLGMGAMQFFAPILAKNYEGGYGSASFFRMLAPVGIVISILLTLLAVIGNAIASLFGQNANGYLIGLVFFLVPFVLTQFMMNWAVLNMFAPIAILTCTAIGANPIGPLVLVATGALTAFMTPLATPSVAMFMGIGGYDQKTMFKMGWLPALILCIVNVVWVMTIFPAY